VSGNGKIDLRKLKILTEANPHVFKVVGGSITVGGYPFNSVVTLRVDAFDKTKLRAFRQNAKKSCIVYSENGAPVEAAFKEGDPYSKQSIVTVGMVDYYIGGFKDADTGKAFVGEVNVYYHNVIRELGLVEV
jgi:hypothetical protein